MKLPVLVSIVLCALFSNSCSTPYQPSDFLGGFTELQLSSDSYQVSFGGNAYTSTQRAIDFTLLRCAELALENGYQYFVVIDADNRTNERTSTNLVFTGRRGEDGRAERAERTSTTSKPSTTNTIRLLNQKPTDGFSYDAAITAASIRGKYGL
jgi:hypothetical protein